MIERCDETDSLVDAVGDLGDALIELRHIVKKYMLPICQEHGGEIGVAEAIEINHAFEITDKALLEHFVNELPD